MCSVSETGLKSLSEGQCSSEGPSSASRPPAPAFQSTFSYGYHGQICPDPSPCNALTDLVCAGVSEACRLSKGWWRAGGGGSCSTFSLALTLPPLLERWAHIASCRQARPLGSLGCPEKKGHV